MFCTAFIGVLDIKTGLMRYCNAGHNPPVIIDTNGNSSFLPVTSNLALGIWKGFEFESQEVMIERGSTVFLYTDGVNESENVDKELFGEDRLLKLLSEHNAPSPREMVETLYDEIRNHAGKADQNDDITILCCKLTDSNSSEKRLVMRNNISDIALLTEFVDNLCEENQLPMDMNFKLNLALEEAVVNVMKYAYPEDEEHEVILSVKSYDKELIFELSDSGKFFDPTMVKDADVTLSAEERQIGGLGIFLVKNIMRSVEYKREGERNVLKMTYELN